MHKNKLFILGLDITVLLFIPTAPYITDFMMNSLPQCTFLQFGLQCPSCGGTRCVKNIFTGNFSDALFMNPFVFLMIQYAAILLVLLNVSLFSDRVRPVIRFMTHHVTIIVLVCAFVAFGILRNFIPAFHI